MDGPDIQLYVCRTFKFLMKQFITNKRTANGKRGNGKLVFGAENYDKSAEIVKKIASKCDIKNNYDEWPTIF
jgi:hypothetical protein